MSSEKLYIMYLRKSRADADYSDETTLSRHKARLEDLCRSMGIVCSEVIEEVGSADSIASRPGMIRLLGLVESGAYDGVVCVHMDRLSRGDGSDQALVINTFKYSGTKIITPQKTFDFSNDTDETYAEFDLFFAKNEYRTIKRRLMQGRIDSVMQGKYPAGNAPYGYQTQKIKGEKGYTLQIIPEEAVIVKRIFDMYVNQNLGAYAIASRFNTEGLTNQFGHVWKDAHIGKILNDATYTGKVRYFNRKVIKKVVNGEIHRSEMHSNPDVLIRDGRHEAIISEELFMQAQDVKKKRQVPHLRQASVLVNPLSGILRCGLCGRTMRLRSSDKTGKRALFCPTNGCKCVGNYSDEVERAILEALDQWLENYEVPPQTSQDQQEASHLRKMINSMSNDIESLEKKLKKIYSLFEDDVYSVDEFRERTSATKDEIEKLKSRKQSAAEELQRLEDYEKARAGLVPTVKSVLTSYYDLPTSKEKNIMLKKVIDHVVYTKMVYSTQKRGSTFELKVYPKIPH